VDALAEEVREEVIEPIHETEVRPTLLSLVGDIVRVCAPAIRPAGPRQTELSRPRP
jgi:hypothetical protein